MIYLSEITLRQDLEKFIASSDEQFEHQYALGDYSSDNKSYVTVKAYNDDGEFEFRCFAYSNICQVSCESLREFLLGVRNEYKYLMWI